MFGYVIDYGNVVCVVLEYFIGLFQIDVFDGDEWCVIDVGFLIVDFFYFLYCLFECFGLCWIDWFKSYVIWVY